MSAESVRATSRWITRLIPIVLAGAVGYATYVTVALVCVHYLINERGEAGAAIAILIFYFLTLLLMLGTYLRTIITINTDAGLVPLGPLAIQRREKDKKDKKGKRDPKKSSRGGNLEGQPYYVGPDPNPDSPGLELFYTKDIFVCENDGRPKWCSECCNWKPDRAHHSSEINRCVIRMDHYCPWVGGMIGETTFKYFTQFTMYTFCYCGVVLGAAGSTYQRYTNDAHLIGVLALAGVFGSFTFLMTVTSWRYIALNMTNIDMIGATRNVYQLAVRVPRGSNGTDKYHTVTYPLPRYGPPANGHINGGAVPGPDGPGGYNGVQDQAYPSRDALATRTFAILRTDAGENPWDLGFRHNWQEVMGTNPLDWFLPLRRSPLVNHESQESYYRMGHVMRDVCARHGIQGPPGDESEALEMRDINRGRV